MAQTSPIVSAAEVAEDLASRLCRALTSESMVQRATSLASPSGQVWGSMGRHVLSGPSLFSINGALSRSIVVNEARLDLRGEAFNLSNTPQFSNPNTSMTNSNFGFVTRTISSGTGVNGTGGGRAVQFAVKIIF